MKRKREALAVLAVTRLDVRVGYSDALATGLVDGVNQ